MSTTFNNEVSLRLLGKRFRYWERIRISRSIDSIDTIAFSTPFEATDPAFRSTFQPMSFRAVDVDVDEDRLFTGLTLDVDPEMSPESSVASVGAYALPGLLNDCTAPVVNFPLEFNNLNLRQIAERCAGFFKVGFPVKGIGVAFDGDPGPVFKRVALDAKMKVMLFLAKLAQQRNFIISNTPDGKVLFRKVVSPGQPVATLQQGESPLTDIRPAFKPQSYFSEITGIKPTKIGSPGATYTLKNPHATANNRPHTFEVKDARGADLKAAVEAKMGHMFANAASFTASIATWRTPKGELWEPNRTVKILAPSAMIYNPYEFLIKSVDLIKSPEAETVLLGLAMPGSYSGEIPETLPWVG